MKYYEHTTRIMSEIIYIPNIENYTIEMNGGGLRLTPKTLKKSNNEFMNELITRACFMVLQNREFERQSDEYESEIIETADNDERREFLRKEIGTIHQLKVTLRKKFIKRFSEDLWNNIYGKSR